ncbi:MAG: hypothetical protein Q9170_007717 [Blastenia crenularia]
MASFPKLTVTPQCLGHLRRLAGLRSSAPNLPLHSQIRGKKKSSKQPHTINVRLLEDIRGYGRKGSIIPIAPGRMRNIYYPQRKAEYVTAAQLRTTNQKDILLERDFNFGVERAKGNAAPEEEDKVVDVKIEMLTPKQAHFLIEAVLPPTIVFYRPPIATSEAELQPQPSLGSSINAIGGEVPVQRAPEPKPLITKIFGSVKTSHMVNTIKAVLAEDKDGARVVLGPEDIHIIDEASEERGVEEDRLKALGEYEIEIRLKDMEPIKRTVSIRAQEVDS